MQWKIVGALGGFGVVMGIASVFGYTQHVEPVLWIAIAVFSSFWIEKHVHVKLFLHGVCTGTLIGTATSALKAALFSTYLSRNADAAKGFVDTGGVDPRAFVLVVGVLIGFVYGMIIGGIAMAMRKWLPHRSRSNF